MVVTARSSSKCAVPENHPTLGQQGEGHSHLMTELFYLKDIKSPEQLWAKVPKWVKARLKKSGREEEMLSCEKDGHRRVVSDEEWTDLAEMLGWDLINVKDPGKGVVCPKTGFMFVPEAGGSSIECIFPPILSTRFAQLQFLQALDKMFPWAENHKIYVVKYSAQLLDIATEGLDENKGKRYIILNQYFKEALESLARFWDIASHQSQVCVGTEEFLEVLNIGFFSAAFVALGANCPVMDGEYQEQNAARLDIWDLLDLANPDAVNRCGIAPIFSSWESFRDWVSSLDAIMILKDGDYVAQSGTFGELGFQTLEELRNALAGLFTTIWTHLRLKMPTEEILTVELRPIGQQPFDGADEAFAAMFMGLAVNAKKVTAYRKEIAAELGLADDSPEFHQLADDWLKSAQTYGPHNAQFNGCSEKSREMFAKVLELAREGLLLRGYGEEVALRILEQRLESGVIPAMITLEQWREGGAEQVVRENSLNHNRDWVQQQIQLYEEELAHAA